MPRPIRNSALIASFFTPVLLFLCCLSALAQSTVDGALDGHISDPSGAVVSGVHITIHSNATNSDSATTTDSSGYFRVNRLQPGDYSLDISATGFSQIHVAHATVEIGRVTTLDEALAITRGEPRIG
jgi:hypothetical protein